ncbi:MAG TPA: hypothetical protein VH062_35625 [Polyangiaceae bacterium]|nr:hypothetical protein [Polyangiaceae bacterium]
MDNASTRQLDKERRNDAYDHLAMAITRETLYAEVWAEPMTTVATRYDVSSNYLARICERLKVPRPPRGYWQQRAVGREEPIPELPEPEPGDDLTWNRDGEPYWRHPPAPIFSPITKRGTRRPERPKTHPILVAVRDDFEDSKEHRFLDDGYLRPKKHDLPDILTSKEALPRALRVANDLFLTLEDQGHWVRMAPQGVVYQTKEFDHRVPVGRSNGFQSRAWQAAPKTLVFVGGVAIGLSLFEIAEEVEVVWSDGRYVRAPKTRAAERRRLEPSRTHRQNLPSGKFGLLAYSPYGVTWSRYWHETERNTFSELHDGITGELERAAPEIVRLTEQARREHEERQRKWETERRENERKEAERRRLEAEERRRKDMQSTIERWRNARDIRAYVADVKRLVAEEGLSIVEGGDVDNELRWALALLPETPSGGSGKSVLRAS